MLRAIHVKDHLEALSDFTFALEKDLVPRPADYDAVIEENGDTLSITSFHYPLDTSTRQILLLLLDASIDISDENGDLRELSAHFEKGTPLLTENNIRYGETLTFKLKETIY